ncbi:S-layer protein [Thermococcus sp. 101 C5]|uniref:S-layer protein n=1 Tax=Thermococcus sp. 101 C5 TaxID=2654197 RepID=UPI00128D1592|nr:S-layer protein [Thermococcus sp. 101 C5]MPW39543.1 S-layer protein [Thermococcus sp. 101 C5]
MKVRKIAALAVGAAMVGATLGYANAALPGKEFFVKDGMPNVKIVVGANAPSTMDVASAADVALAIGSLLYTSEEVEASGVSVVVKRETTQYPDPIPVYSNLYEDTGVDPNTDNEELSDLADDNFWYNGSADAYNGAYSAWDSWMPKFEGEIENMDQINGDAQVDWDFEILDIELVDENQETITYPPKEATLKIPAGNFTVTLNYAISKWEKETVTNSTIWGSLDQTKTTDTVVDDDQPEGYNFVETVYDGVDEGDTFTILGNTYYVLKLNATEGSMTYGKDHGEVWFRLGDIKDYDGYKVKAVDISVNENRALVEVTSPEGVDQLVILNKDEEKDVFGDGGIILKLTDTFVGIDGNLIATIKVVTNQKTVKTGDELIPGWEVRFDFSGGKIVKVTLTNKNDLEGKELDILGKYKMYYKSEVYTKDVDKDGKEEYAVKSYIVVEPVEKTWETKELKVGDEFEGWTIEAIKGEAYTKVTPMVPAEPITVLDSELDLNAVDSNLILVGGPVANAITKYLVDQGLSTVDWENSDGDLEYIEDAFGTFDVLIVAGKDRYATRDAAKELMEYLAGL